jgi:hypothetical protein
MLSIIDNDLKAALVRNNTFLFQAQVSLDHDYCSSGNKANKRQRWNNPTPQMSKDLQHRQQSQTPHVNKDQRWNNHTAPMSKDLQQQRQKWSMVPNGDQV